MPNVLFMNGIRDSGIVRVLKIIDNNTLQYVNQGTCNIYSTLETNRFDRSLLVLDINPQQNINIANADVIFNQISDPDSHKISISKAQAVCQQASKLYCINHPDKVISTSREHTYDLLKDHPDIIVPRTIKSSPASAQELKSEIDRLEKSYPVLIRKCGDHNAMSLALLRSEEDADKLHPSYYSHECYLTEYIDYRDENGIYTKYRLVSVNGNIFIRHIMYNDQWEIHSHVRRNFMKDNEEYFRLEADTMAFFETGLKPQIAKPMRVIHEAVGLDVFGVDCSIDERGRLQIFEINANMSLLYNPYPKPNAWQAQVDAIQDALITFIMSKADNPTGNISVDGV